MTLVTEEPELSISELRNLRQLDVLTEVKQKVYVIGCGSVGSVIAKIIGPSGQDMIFYDRDTVEAVNLGPQRWNEEDIGKFKVTALSEEIKKKNSEIKIIPVKNFFTKDWKPVNPDEKIIVFCCVDDIEVRADIYTAVKPYCDLFIDTRCGGLVYRVICIKDTAKDAYYATTLFKREESLLIPCSSRNIHFVAEEAGNLASALFFRYNKSPEDQLPLEISGNMYDFDRNFIYENSQQ